MSFSFFETKNSNPGPGILFSVQLNRILKYKTYFELFRPRLYPWNLCSSVMIAIILAVNININNKSSKLYVLPVFCVCELGINIIINLPEPYINLK